MLKEKLIIILLLCAMLPMAVNQFRTHVHADDVQIIKSPWTLSQSGGAVEQYQNIDSHILKGKNKIKITYDLHGTCLLPGDASAIVFDQNGWKMISLSNYGKNCKYGEQNVEISLSDFKDITTRKMLDTNTSLTGVFHVRFWLNKPFTINISHISLLSDSQGSNLILLKQVLPTPTPKISLNSESIYITNSGSYNAEYFDNQNLSGNPKVKRNDNSINFIWNRGTPDVLIPSDHFSARWTKNVNLTSGTYTFTINADDGIRVIIDGKSILNKWFDQSVTKYIITKNIISGNHSIVVEYYEDKYNATIQFDFKKIGGITATPTQSKNPVSITPTPATKPITTTSTVFASTSGWEIKSVDAMKETKDAICGQRDSAWISKYIDKAVEIGANYVAISTPYENPGCGDARVYTKTWINAIRSKGLKVWFRQMPLAFEGIYGIAKNNSSSFINLITQYIKDNAENYKNGDIFTPIPEPQNGGISGITYCAQSICQFTTKEAFNSWLRDVMTASQLTFQSIGINGMKIGYFGFDGFVAWGDNNPDWHGILEDATIKQMGNITIDHYPEAVSETMTKSLDDLQARYPSIPIIIGEWGTITGGNVEQQVQDTMSAAKRPGVKGFNYWQFGPGGAGEQLINDDFTNKIQFDDVERFYKN